MATSRGVILSSINAMQRIGTSYCMFPGILTQVRNYAARKGTREKAKKKKVKVEVKKLTLEEKIKKSKKISIVKPDAFLFNDDHKFEPVDDVYFVRYFKHKIYPFSEAIQCHREHMHPTMYNKPDSLVNIIVELNMEGTKKTRTIDGFHKMVPIRSMFDHGEERKILVFSKTEEEIKDALEGGAALAGGADIVKLIVDGSVSLQNYDTIIAHPNMMPELLTIRGLLKRKHPSLKAGTLGPNIKMLVYTQLHGIKYRVQPYDNFPRYGITNLPIGTLNMETQQLEDNLQDAVDSIMSAKPKRLGPFITRIRVECAPSNEKFKIDHTIYTKEVQETDDKEKDDVEEEEDENVVAISNA